MSATNAGFGLRVHTGTRGGGRAVARAYPGGIASGYASNIFKGSAVSLTTAGVLNVVAAGAASIGAFAGVEYTDTNTKVRVYQKHWPASTVAEDIVAYVYDDPETVYEIQADGSLAQTSVGDMADFTAAADDTGNTMTGLSNATLSTSLAGAAASAQFQILGLAPYVDNAWGDAFTIVLVRINEHQMKSSINAF